MKDYLDPDSEEYLFATLDATSPWREEATEYNYNIRGGEYIKGTMSKEQYRKVKKDNETFFCQAGKGQFYEQLDNGERVVPKPVITSYEKLEEEERLRNLRENPIKLFLGFTYDGQTLISHSGVKEFEDCYIGAKRKFNKEHERLRRRKTETEILGEIIRDSGIFALAICPYN